MATKTAVGMAWKLMEIVYPEDAWCDEAMLSIAVTQDTHLAAMDRKMAEALYCNNKEFLIFIIRCKQNAYAGTPDKAVNDFTAAIQRAREEVGE